jgi:hypothetical protein
MSDERLIAAEQMESNEEKRARDKNAQCRETCSSQPLPRGEDSSWTSSSIGAASVKSATLNMITQGSLVRFLDRLFLLSAQLFTIQ